MTEFRFKVTGKPTDLTVTRPDGSSQSNIPSKEEAFKYIAECLLAQFGTQLGPDEIKEVPDTDNVPDVFKKFLQGLSDDDANTMWLWLDSGDMEQAITFICETHPGYDTSDYDKVMQLVRDDGDDEDADEEY